MEIRAITAAPYGTAQVIGVMRHTESGLEFRRMLEALSDQLGRRLLLPSSEHRYTEAMETDLPRQIREFIELCALDRSSNFQLSGQDPRRGDSSFTAEPHQIWNEGHTWHVVTLEASLGAAIGWLEESYPSEGRHWRAWFKQQHLGQQ